jgi:diguanylate cyclase (GGDEF)-like protein
MSKFSFRNRVTVLARLAAAIFAGLFTAFGIGIWSAGLPSWWVPAAYTGLVAVGLTALIYAWVVKPLARHAVEASRVDELDELTQTLSRHGITVKLFEFMALADRYGNRLSVAIVGIDHLQDLVSEYGDKTRDSALQTITEVLTETIRMPDRIGRYDEDKFLAILPETNMSGACQIAERIRSAVYKTDIGITTRRKVRLTVSIGVTVFRRGEDLNQLLSRATRILAQAKTQGRNRVLTDLAA